MKGRHRGPKLRAQDKGDKGKNSPKSSIAGSDRNAEIDDAPPSARKSPGPDRHKRGGKSTETSPGSTPPQSPQMSQVIARDGQVRVRRVPPTHANNSAYHTPFIKSPSDSGSASYSRAQEPERKSPNITNSFSSTGEASGRKKQAKGDGKGQPQEQSKGDGKGQPQEQSKGDGKGQPRKQSKGDGKGKPQEQSKGEGKGQPQEQSKDDGRGQSQEPHSPGAPSSAAPSRSTGPPSPTAPGATSRSPPTASASPVTTSPAAAASSPPAAASPTASASPTAATSPAAAEPATVAAATRAPTPPKVRGWAEVPIAKLLDECAQRLAGEGSADSSPRGTAQPGTRKAIEPLDALTILCRLGRSNLALTLTDVTKGTVQTLCDMVANSISNDPNFVSVCEPVDVCNAIYFLGKARLSLPPIQETVGIMTKYLSTRIQSFTPTLLSNLAWGIVVLVMKDLDILYVIAQASINRIGDFTAQGLSNVAWAFAKSGIRHANLLDAIAQQSVVKIHDFHNQNLANISWAYAVFAQKRPALMRAIATEALDRIHTFQPNVLVTLIWSFGVVGMRNLEFIRAVSKEAIKRLNDFSCAELVNIVYSYYVLRVMTLEQELMELVSKRVIVRIHEFNPNELSNIAWTYSKAREPDLWETETLFSCIAERVIKQADTLKNSELATLAWSFAHLGFRDDELFEAIAIESMKKMKRFNQKSLAQLAWAFGATRIRHDGFLAELTGKIFDNGWDHYKPFEVAVLSWAFARLLCRSDRLMSLMTVSVVDRMDSFSPIHLSRIAMSLVTLGLWRADLGIGLKRQTQNNEWPLAALIQLCDSVFPHKLLLEDLLYKQLGKLLDDLLRHNDDDLEQQQIIQKSGVENCGVIGTAFVMQRLGIKEPNVDFLIDLEDKILYMQLVCCRYSLVHGNGEKIEGEHEIESTVPQILMEPPCIQSPSHAARTPPLLKLVTDMRHVIKEFSSKNDGEDEIGRVLEGTVQFVATTLPSLSCILALAKLRDFLPSVSVEFVEYMPCVGE